MASLLLADDVVLLGPSCCDHNEQFAAESDAVGLMDFSVQVVGWGSIHVEEIRYPRL